MRSRYIHNICFPFLAVLMAALPCFSQSAISTSRRTGVPYDWSHHYVVFSVSPYAEITATAQRDPRFWHQKIRMEPAPAVAAGPIRRKKKVDWSVTLGGAGSTIVQGMYPAKYTFNVNAAPSCANDYVVFALNVAGSASQASIVGYNNLYTAPGGTGFCPGNGPTVKWAYNTGSAISTSPTLSTDGKKVAWVSNANPPVLHVLTIGTTGSNGTSVTSPAVAGIGNNAVDTARPYGSIGDTRSSPFVDYQHDVAYLGSDDGVLHKFTGIFRGSPAEVSTGGWPIQGIDGANRVLTGLIYDSVSKNIFYGDDLGNFNYIREVGSTIGVCIGRPSPPCLGQDTYELTSLKSPLVDSPIVDSTAQRVYVIVGNNGSGNANVVQTDTQLSSFGPVAAIGKNGSNTFHGAFDHNYFVSPQTGFLYVCGYPAAAPNASPVLYRIGFNSSGVMNTAHDANSLAVASSLVTTRCSPITEFFHTDPNPLLSRDWLFFSVSTGCNAAGGGLGGCIMSFDITSGFPTAATQGRPEFTGTSGIVVDNVSPQPQASSIYFSTEGNAPGFLPCGDLTTGGGCAVKLTQAGLN